MTPYAEVIGDPIAQSKSPVIHNFWLEKLGIDADYRTCHVKPEELADYFALRRRDPAWRGCNVTIPHKEQVAPFVDELESAGAKVGAINTVWPDGKGGLNATNTDIDGVKEALRASNPAGRPVVIIGAGGAARAVFAYLEGLGCASVRVLARNHAKARDTLKDFDLPVTRCPFEPGGAGLADAAIVINATQLGMAGQLPMPQFVLDQLADTGPDCLVFDMVYAPLDTQLLQRAAAFGRTTSHGLTMLVGQARTAFARFFGAVPDPRDDAELFRRLTT
ncbi:MAG: shikimate dehydrogenase [Novosphingobium sp.]